MQIHMIGNAHVDPVWLWPWQAGMDEALATFRSAADRCDEYPEFIYTRGESWLYEQVERLDPKLFGRVRELVAAGRWSVVGGQYIQPDLNAPTASALREQFAVGQAYFLSRFGVRSRVAYNVDSFGHPACLPDILAECGIDAYMFRRPEPHQMELPRTPFRWRGTGGAEVIAYHLPTPYVSGPGALTERVRAVIDATAASIGHGAAFYGVGNHGGGPTKGHIEWVLENRRQVAGVELRFSSPDAFIDAIRPLRAALPVVEGDLQRCFPGCYSVMHDVKQDQRRNSLLLESARGLARVLDPADASPTLETASKDILFCDFHDIVTGTAVPSAWRGVRAMQGRAQILIEESLATNARRLASARLPPVNEHQHVIVNAHDAAFSGLVEIDPWLDFDGWRERWISDDRGRPIEFQQVQAESSLTTRLLLPASVEAFAAMRLLIRTDPVPAGHDPRSIRTDLSVTEARLSNAHVRVDLGSTGIEQLWCDGRPLLAGGGLRLQLRQDSGDTWVHHTDRLSGPVLASLSGGHWLVEESGPLRARVRYEGMLGTSRARLSLSLERDARHLDLDLEIMCQERYRSVQLALETGGWVERRLDGLALAGIEREATGREEPFQAWTRLSGARCALAIATHDAYSLSHGDRALTLTLLRTPQMAWGGTRPIHDGGRRWFTDQGQHAFRFALVVSTAPEDARLEDRALRQRARDRMLPPIAFDAYQGLDRPVARPSLPAVGGTFFTRSEVAAILAEVGDVLADDGSIRRPAGPDAWLNI